MKIAVDSRALLAEQTGIGTYTAAIVRGLAAMDGHEIGLFAPRPLPPSVETGGAVSTQTGRRGFGFLWLQTTLPGRLERWGADVLLSALTIGPPRGQTPFVSVVHDLTPVSHPEWHAERTLLGFLPLWERTVERAASFLCVSQTTARDLAARYPETASRIRVAPNGVDRAFFSPSEDAAARGGTRRTYAGGHRFILYLGTLEPRKNVETLVDACERLWRSGRGDADLVLAGGRGWKSETLRRRIEASPFRDRIHLPGYAERGAARELYRAADVFAYPSLEEGFGLPLLEALSCGTPSVTSDAEALVEVGGEATLRAPARDAAALADALERALGDPDLRAMLRAAGPARAAAFRWEDAARETAAAIAEAAERRP